MRMMEPKQRSQIFVEASKRGIDNELLHEIVFNVTGKESIHLPRSSEGSRQNKRRMHRS